MSDEGQPPDAGVNHNNVNNNANRPQPDVVLVEDVVESESEEEEAADAPNEASNDEEEDTAIDDEEEDDDDDDDDELFFAGPLAHFQGLSEEQQASFIDAFEETLGAMAMYVEEDEEQRNNNNQGSRNNNNNNASSSSSIALVTRLLAVVRRAARTGAGAGHDEAAVVPNAADAVAAAAEQPENLALQPQQQQQQHNANPQPMAMEDDEDDDDDDIMDDDVDEDAQGAAQPQLPPPPPPPQPQQQQQNAEPLQIIDEEEWLNRNGLAEEPRFGAESYNNHQRALQQQQQERQYQKQVHEKIFMEEESKGGEWNLYSTQERKKCLELWKNESLHLKGDSGNVLTVNLAKIARHSQMVFSLACSNTILHKQQEEDRKDDGNSSPELKRQRKEEEKDQQQQPNTTTSNTAVAPSLNLSLEEFSYSAVESFLELIDSCQPANDEDDKPTLPIHAINRLGENDFAVDCCRIAHYLQCWYILDQLVEDILMLSIDSENCMSLCQLADQLSLARLHEASLKHILKSLDSINDDDDESTTDRESNSSGENDDLINTTLPDNITAKLNTEYLTPELQRKITHIKQILMSQSRKTIFFDTFVEYIAMLAEQYQYYKERLEEAREQQAIREPDTRDWKYSQTKIDQQAIKVERLKNFLHEQKKVFGVGQRAKQ